MPRKKKSPAADAALPVIPSEVIDQIVKGPVSADAVSVASNAFNEALIERGLGAELSTPSATFPALRSPRRRAIAATGRAPRPCRRRTVVCASTFPATPRAADVPRRAPGLGLGGAGDRASGECGRFCVGSAAGPFAAASAGPRSVILSACPTLAQRPAALASQGPCRVHSSGYW